jgi:hypothetical protein
MAAVVFDAGGLIALERGERKVGALLAAAAEAGVEVRTPAACVAQVWREPVRQAKLARALRGFVEHSLNSATARECGRLLARANTNDVVDAAVASLVDDGDTVVTSDRGDIARLLEAAGRQARVWAV